MVTSLTRCKTWFPFNVFWGSVFFKIVAVWVITTIMNCDARNPEGFLSIDCGSESATYSDSQTGLTWENDGQHTLTGMNELISVPNDSNLSNREALRTFRYFPEKRSKHCYELPMPEKDNSFLIRAMFLHGGSSQLKPPIQFSVYVDSSFWFSLHYDKLNSTAPPDIREGIFFSPGRATVHFCLVPEKGIPFVSSLEVRLLDSKGLMNSLTDDEHKTLSFTTLRRWSASISPGASAIRYPDDEYDRLWTPLFLGDTGSGQGWNTTDVSSSKLNTSREVNYVPPEVMLKAWTADGSYDEIDVIGKMITYIMRLDVNLPEYTAANTPNGRYLYAILYFSPPHGNRGYNMTIQWNSESPRQFQLKPGISTTVYKCEPLWTSSTSVYLESSSPHYPLLNAIEIYEENLLSPLLLLPYSVKPLEILKESLNLTDWQGDPCMPVPYSWLTCITTSTSTPGIVEYFLYQVVNSITLSKVKNTRSLLDTNASDIVENGLQMISITGSDVDDETSQYVSSTTVSSLDFTSNRITKLPRQLGINVTSLNLSQNAITGELFLSQDSFLGSPLEHLNLSHNLLTSPSESKMMNFSKLVVLDVSHNHLNSQSSLERLVRQNNATVEEIYVSNNYLTGSFSSDLYISSLRRIRKVSFDGNSIHGKLDLSLWHSMLQSVVANKSNISSLEKLFSLVNNKVEDISPPAKEFEPLIRNLIHIQGFNESGFLLGGNPYCKGAKLLAQRYLCRYSIHDQLSEHQKRKKSILPIVLGLLAAIFCCISFVTAWKLWRQVRRLQQIQRELTERNVQPPLYLYRDLKVATKDFHKFNELGRGGFGAVYKGSLADGTTIAVKKLFNSQQKQVLHEFLNEVVLITGIKHKNLAQLKGCCITSTERILVYEFADKGNLAEALWGRAIKEILPWNTRFSICVGIARGLSYLHEELQPRIIHRDIKAANILLDKKWTPKIADFGLARPFLEEDTEAYFTHVAGTRGYLAPEYYQGQLTEKADVYGFGILLLEIVSGRKCLDPTLSQERLYVKTWAEKLYQDGMLLELLQPELRENGAYDENEVTRVIKVALICVQIDPKFRATMFQAITMLLTNEDVSSQLRSAMNHDSGTDFELKLMSGFSCSGTDSGISGYGSGFNSLLNNARKSFRKISLKIEKSDEFSQDVVESPLLLNSDRIEEAETSKARSVELTQK